MRYDTFSMPRGREVGRGGSITSFFVLSDKRAFFMLFLCLFYCEGREGITEMGGELLRRRAKLIIRAFTKINKSEAAYLRINHFIYLCGDSARGIGAQSSGVRQYPRRLFKYTEYGRHPDAA